jgi:hypothetical protein
MTADNEKADTDTGSYAAVHKQRCQWILTFVPADYE